MPFFDSLIFQCKNGLSKDQWILKDLIETNVRQRGEIGGNELKMVRRVDALCDIYGIRRGSGRNGKSPRGDFANAPSTVREVCEYTGVDFKEYNHNRGLRNLNDEVLNMVEVGDIPMSTAARLISKLTPEQQRELVSMVPDGEIISKATVEQYIARIKELEDENRWYNDTESESSEHVDTLTRRIQDLEENNERLWERHQTVGALKSNEMHISLTLS